MTSNPIIGCEKRQISKTIHLTKDDGYLENVIKGDLQVD